MWNPTLNARGRGEKSAGHRVAIGPSCGGYIPPRDSPAAPDGPPTSSSRPSLPQGIPRVTGNGCLDCCVNRGSYVHCDSRSCPCGELCGNKPFHLLKTPRIQTFLTENRCAGAAVIRLWRSSSSGDGLELVSTRAISILNDHTCISSLAYSDTKNNPSTSLHPRQGPWRALQAAHQARHVHHRVCGRGAGQRRAGLPDE